MRVGSAYRKPAGCGGDLSDYLGTDGSLYDGVLCDISQKCRTIGTVWFKRNRSFYRIDEEMEEKDAKTGRNNRKTLGLLRGWL